MSDRNPATLMDELEAARNNLKELGDQYAVARRDKAGFELEYQRNHAKVIVDLQHKADNKEIPKVPAEDIRKALATFVMDEQTYSDYLSASAEVDALDRLIKVEQSNITAIQTELQQLRVEFTHAN